MTLLNYGKWKELYEQTNPPAQKPDMAPKTYLNSQNPTQGKIGYSITVTPEIQSLDLKIVSGNTTRKLELSDTEIQDQNMIGSSQAAKNKSAKFRLTSAKMVGENRETTTVGFDTAAAALSEFLAYSVSSGSEQPAGADFARFWETLGTSELKTQVPPGVKKSIDFLFRMDVSQVAAAHFNSDVRDMTKFKNGMDSLKKYMTTVTSAQPAQKPTTQPTPTKQG